MKLALAFIAAMFLLTSCGSNEGNKEVPQTQPTTTSSAETLTGNWYRQYEGTIAGKHVVVDLEHTGDNRLVGNYTYDEHDMLLQLYAENDSSINGSYYIFESAPTSREQQNDYHNNNHWVVTFSNSTIKGQWVSEDGKKKYEISLTEVDYKNSYSFQVFRQYDSASVKLNGFSVTAQATDQWYMPINMAAPEKEFLTTSLLQIIGCKSGEQVADCIKKQNNDTYFDSYRKEVDSDITEEDSHMYNHEMSHILSVVYNKKGFVIIEEGNYQYLGGAHGMHSNKYTNLDVAGKKVWRMGDVMTVDTAALSAILETEARRIFKIATGEKLSERFLVDTIDVTDNFYFTSAGVTFVYAPYAIASYADGDVYLFIPYNRLSAYLTPEFKKRMQLL